MNIQTLARAFTVAVVAVVALVAPAQAVSPSITVKASKFEANSTNNAWSATLKSFDSNSDYMVFINVEDGDAYLTSAAAADVSALAGYNDPDQPASAIGFQASYANVVAALKALRFDAPAQTGTLDVDIKIVETDLDRTGLYYDPATGHYYLAKIGDADNWTDAKTRAATLTLFGATGYLATITSQAENDFIADYTDAADVWIGARRKDPANCSELKWIWDAGPEAGQEFFLSDVSGIGGTAIDSKFTSWADGEPNNWDGGGGPCVSSWAESYVATNYSGDMGMWNDFDTEQTGNYLAEFFAGLDSINISKSTTFTIVGEGALPETGAPVALLPLLFGVGAVGVGAATLRRRKN